MNRRPWFYPALSLMLWLAGSLMAGAIILWPAAAHDEAAVETAIAALQAQMGAATQVMLDQEAEMASLRTLIENLAANGIQTVATRHGLVQVNNLPDPFRVECATTVDTPTECDPRSETYDVEGDDLTWDAGDCPNGTLTIVGDVATYTPAPGFVGVDVCTADVRDDAKYALDVEIKVTVEVKP